MMPTPQLRALRDEIDHIDSELAQLLAKRFRVVDRVIQVKRMNRIPAMLPDRIEEVVQNARARGDSFGVPPDSMEKLWRLLIDETIRYEEPRLTQD